MFVTLLDTESEGRMLLFGTRQMLELAEQVSGPHRMIDGWQLGSMFAWLRPNDLVWNYWVNNYLLGQDPPAFDILAWNADTTRLIAAFHRQLLDMVAGNQMVHPGAMTVLGTPIDLSRISTDTYVAAGLTDHITPWQTCYRTTQLVSGHARVRAVLQRPHPDRGGRPEAPRARVLPQPGDAAHGRAVAGGRATARGIVVGALGGLAGRSAPVSRARLPTPWAAPATRRSSRPRAATYVSDGRPGCITPTVRRRMDS